MAAMETHFQEVSMNADQTNLSGPFSIAMLRITGVQELLWLTTVYRLRLLPELQVFFGSFKPSNLPCLRGLFCDYPKTQIAIVHWCILTIEANH